MDNVNSQKIFEYTHFFYDMLHIKEIDHIPDEFFVSLAESVPDYDFSGILVVENRMAISFGVFDVLYNLCKKLVLKSQTISDKEFIDRFEELNLATKEILCMNGEMNSAINRRMRMLKLDLLTNLEEELHFVRLVSLKFKKSGIIWFYRQKVIAQYFEKVGTSKETVERVINVENEALEEFFSKYPRNYYGWLYKKFLIDEFVVKLGYTELLWSEYLKVKEYCERHVHDYCAFHLLGCLYVKLKKTGKYGDLKPQEIEWANSLVKKYEEMYLMEKLDLHDKGVRYHELESAKKFLKVLEKA